MATLYQINPHTQKTNVFKDQKWTETTEEKWSKVLLFFHAHDDPKPNQTFLDYAKQITQIEKCPYEQFVHIYWSKNDTVDDLLKSQSSDHYKYINMFGFKSDVDVIAIKEGNSYFLNARKTSTYPIRIKRFFGIEIEEGLSSLPAKFNYFFSAKDLETPSRHNDEKISQIKEIPSIEVFCPLLSSIFNGYELDNNYPSVNEALKILESKPHPLPQEKKANNESFPWSNAITMLLVALLFGLLALQYQSKS